MSHRTLAALGVVFRGFGILFQGETDGQTWTIIFERRGSRKLSSLPPFPPLNLDVRCFPLQVKNISCGPFCSTKLETEGTLSSCCYSQTVSVLTRNWLPLTDGLSESYSMVSCYCVEELRKTEQDTDLTVRDGVCSWTQPKEFGERIHDRESEAGVGTVAWPPLEIILLELNDFHGTCRDCQGPINYT